MDNVRAYRRLLDDFCSLTDMTAVVRDREQFYRTADITVDGIDFSLLPGTDQNAGRLLFFCDFGELPERATGLAMRRLLEANLMMLGPGNPNFGINFASGHVLLSGGVPIAGTGAEELKLMLEHYAARAREWRENWFLLEEERNMGGKRSGNAGGLALMHRLQKAPGAVQRGGKK